MGISVDNVNPQKVVYECRHLAFLIPTINRPQKLRNLLKSLAEQTVPCGRVIIIDGGDSIENVVMEFTDRLPVEYYECHPPGQIVQRNVGIAKLDESTPLVGFLDDDLVLEPDVTEKILALWNRVEINTAGIGCNITNIPLLPFSFLLALTLMYSSVPGQVLSSGFGSRIFNVTADICTQWLGGGYTVWRRQVLLEFPQENINTRWAIGEDLRYSYPIGKKYPLYVCAGAKVRHEHLYDQYQKNVVYRYRGRKESLALLYFVESHPELSRTACLWMLLSTAILRVGYGCAAFIPPKLQYARGQMEAIWIFLKSLLLHTDLRKELEG